MTHYNNGYYPALCGKRKCLMYVYRKLSSSLAGATATRCSKLRLAKRAKRSDHTHFYDEVVINLIRHYLFIYLLILPLLPLLMRSCARGVRPKICNKHGWGEGRGQFLLFKWHFFICYRTSPSSNISLNAVAQNSREVTFCHPPAPEEHFPRHRAGYC